MTHLYNVLRHVIGLRFSLVKSPGFDKRLAFFLVNHSGYVIEVSAGALNADTMPSCSEHAHFHQ